MILRKWPYCAIFHYIHQSRESEACLYNQPLKAIEFGKLHLCTNLKEDFGMHFGCREMVHFTKQHT